MLYLWPQFLGGIVCFYPMIELNHDVFVELLQPLMEDVEVNTNIVEEDDTNPYALVQKESKVNDCE